MELQIALSALSQGFTIIKAAIAARDDVKLNSALTDMSDRLMAAYSAGLDAAASAHSLQMQLHAAQAQIAQLNMRLEERQSYLLHQIRPGAFTYILKEPESSGQPIHHLCQTCFDSGRKVVLQATVGGDILRCPENTAHNLQLRAQSWSPVPPPRGPSPY